MTAGAVLLTCSIFQARADLAQGLLIGQLSGFRYALLFLALSVGITELTGGKHPFTFSMPDVLLVGFFGWILFTYDQTSHLHPGQILFLGRLILLWFLLRAGLQVTPLLQPILLFILMCLGILSSFWSFAHVYGHAATGNSIFHAADFAFEPGLVAGFLSVILPLSLSVILRFQDYRKFRFSEPRTGVYYAAWISFILLFAALGACGNPVASTAAVCASLWVGWMRIAGWKHIKRHIKRRRMLFAMSTLFLFLFITGLPEVARLLHLESPGHRSLIWNVSTRAILERPFLGHGLGSYPVSYANAQASYFASGKASEVEKAAACFPDQAFNEYLHIGLEAGIVGLLLFLLWIGFALRMGIRRGLIGVSGSILSLSVLAMYTYPLHLPAFWIVLIFLTALSSTGDKHTAVSAPFGVPFPFVGSLAALVCVMLFLLEKDPEPSYREWKTVTALYEQGKYRTAAAGYRCLYPDLCNQYPFLKEGASCFCEIGCFEEAEQWIERALLLSADPELYDLKAEIKSRMKAYPEAEACLEKVIGMLPWRTESYLHLARLYADSAYHRPQELEKTIGRIMQLHLAGNRKAIEELKSILRPSQTCFSSLKTRDINK